MRGRTHLFVPGGGSGPATSFSPIDPSQSWIREDFLGFSPNGASMICSMGWTATNVGSAPVPTYAAPTYPRIGVLNFRTAGAATTGQGGMLTLENSAVSNSLFIPNMSGYANWELHWIFRLEQTNAVRIRLGLSDNVGAVPQNNFIALRFDTNQGDANFQFSTRVAAGVETLIDTLVPADLLWHRVRARSLVAGQVEFTLYDAAGVQQAQGTINSVPTANLRPSLLLITDANAQKGIDLDYFGMLVTGLAR